MKKNRAWVVPPFQDGLIPRIGFEGGYMDSSPGKNHTKKLMPRIPNAVLTFGESTFNREDLLESTLDLNWQ
jgi:hypothetical protein